MGASARFVALAAAGVLAALPVLAEPKWLRLESPSFVVVGAVSDRTLRKIASRLEQFREAFATVMSRSRASVALPTVVVVFPNERAYKPFWPLYEGKPRLTSGLFLRSPDANYISLNAEYGDAVYRLVYHEYTHFITSKLWAAPPLWLNEGLAEFYSTLETTPSGDRVDLGRGILEHVHLLRTTSLIPLEQLLAADHSSPLYNEWNRQGVFYAQSWALVHMLAIGSEARRGQLVAFLDGFRGGMPPAQVFREAFRCEPAQLQRELAEYVRQPAFRFITVRLKEPVAAATLELVTPVSAFEAESYLGDLLARMGRVDEGRARLEAVRKADPNLARASAALGLLHAREGRLDDALPLLEQAVAQESGDASYQYGLGATIVQSLVTRGGAPLDPKALERARAALARATELRPDFADALANLGFVQVLAGEPEQGRKLIDRARVLVPAREDYTLMLAEAYAMSGNLAVASSIAQKMATSAQTEEGRAAARLMVERIGAARDANTANVASAAPGAEGGSANDLNNLGLQAYDQGRYEEALQHFRRSTEKDPQQPFAWNNLGRALSRLDRREEAIAAFERQIAVSPEDQYAHRNLANELWRAGRLPEAESALMRHLGIKPQDTDAVLDLGRVQWQAGKPREALETYERATPAPGVRAVALIEQAFLAQSLGARSKALAAVDAALARSPAPGDYADAALLLAGPPPDLARAEEYAKRAAADAAARLEQAPFDEALKEHQALSYALGTAWAALGWVAFQRQNVAVAESHLQAAWSLMHQPPAAAMLGTICLSRGQQQRAIEWFARAAAASPAAQGARGRLEKLVPDAVKREALVAREQAQLSAAAVVEVPALPGVSGTVRVALSIDASGRVQDSRILEGATAPSPTSPQLAGVTLPPAAAGHEVGRLVRVARLTCEPGQPRCLLGFEPMLPPDSRFVR